MMHLQPKGWWWAAVPRERWPHPAGERPDEQADWDPRFGDRKQEVVFIGQRMDVPAITAALDACLIDEALAATDSRAWAELPDPFPALEVESEGEGQD